MSMSQQESLLPGTKAIRKGTLEQTPYKGGWLVRYKSLAGVVYQHRTKSLDEANEFYQKYFDELRKDSKAVRLTP